MVWFVIIQIFLIFFYIHKESSKIKLSYQKQKNEKLKQELIEQKQNLAQLLHEKQHQKEIKDFAINNLEMQKIKLNQIKILPNE